MPGLPPSPLRVAARLAAAAVLTLAGVRAVQAEPSVNPPAAVLYRVFLADGGVLVSYGEFARVGDRVIVSIPVGGTETSPVLHTISIADKDVEWPRTNAYAQAARARHYALTQGDADFARLTREVADTLYQVGATDDPAKRVVLAESARRQLAAWPDAHFGYRAPDLQQMASWLDEVVTELRVAAGQSSFDLAFVANIAAPAAPSVELLPAPSLQDRLEYGFTAARVTPEASQRVSLLRSILDVLAPALAPQFVNSWMADLYTRVSSALAVEVRHDDNYRRLSSRALARAQVFERRADVPSLERVIRWVLAEDARLQRARPADVAALLATLDVKLDGARRLRLARDAWALRSEGLHRYWREVRQGLDRLIGLREWLTAVRQLAGPSPGALRLLTAEATSAERELKRVRPPAEAAAAHATLVSAAGMALRAATTRLDAVRSGSMETAWQASSAAAGSLLFLEQATVDLRRITRTPQPAR